jgi:hypothetical protein
MKLKNKTDDDDDDDDDDDVDDEDDILMRSNRITPRVTSVDSDYLSVGTRWPKSAWRYTRHLPGLPLCIETDIRQQNQLVARKSLSRDNSARIGETEKTAQAN